MENRNFKLDTEWSMIHYPEKPRGFGILIIGDERHFVDEKSSFWTQNEGKWTFIQKLREAGYTIFYSNLYGKNWGSDKAVQLAKRLYEYIIRTEIINENIHIIAEGMGALVALRLIDIMDEHVRSTVLLNPVLSLKEHLKQEKEHKFFYKKLMRELSQSYEKENNHMVELFISDDKEPEIQPKVPTKIIHVLAGNRAYKQSNILKQLSVKWEDENAPVTVCYMLPEKKQQISHQVTTFLKKHEKIL